jgi:two-component system, cell cycle sensor histidine kinase and response regulator CckA
MIINIHSAKFLSLPAFLSHPYTNSALHNLEILLCTSVVYGLDSLQVKNILLLFTFEPGLPANDLIYTNLRATLDRQLDEPINYYIEYLDRSRFPDEEYQRNLFDLYKQKYSDKKIDVLVPIGQGMDLILEKYGKETFTGLPTIFIEVQRRPHDAPPFFGKSHTTGILMELDLKKNLEIAL